MYRVRKTMRLVVEECMAIQPGESVLVVSDDYGRSMMLGQEMADTIKETGAEVVLAVIPGATIAGQEPPKTLAGAIQQADVVVMTTERPAPFHTNARQKSSARVYTMNAELREDHYARDITKEDLYQLRDRATRLANIFTEANDVRVRSPLGTDVRFSLKGRTAMAVQPFARGLAVIPDFAKATIAPVEGTAEGTVVIDAFLMNWGYRLPQPLVLTVQKGRITDIKGPEAESKRLWEIAHRDEGASVYPCQFSMGCSHTVKKIELASRWESGKMGLAEFAMGRNNDIGGQNWSSVHLDTIMTEGTVELDGRVVMDKGTHVF